MTIIKPKTRKINIYLSFALFIVCSGCNIKLDSSYSEDDSLLDISILKKNDYVCEYEEHAMKEYLLSHYINSSSNYRDVLHSSIKSEVDKSEKEQQFLLSKIKEIDSLRKKNKVLKQNISSNNNYLSKSTDHLIRAINLDSELSLSRYRLRSLQENNEKLAKSLGIPFSKDGVSISTSPSSLAQSVQKSIDKARWENQALLNEINANNNIILSIHSEMKERYAASILPVSEMNNGGSIGALKYLTDEKYFDFAFLGDLLILLKKEGLFLIESKSQRRYPGLSSENSYVLVSHLLNQTETYHPVIQKLAIVRAGIHVVLELLPELCIHETYIERESGYYLESEYKVDCNNRTPHEVE